MALQDEVYLPGDYVARRGEVAKAPPVYEQDPNVRLAECSWAYLCTSLTYTVCHIVGMLSRMYFVSRGVLSIHVPDGEADFIRAGRAQTEEILLAPRVGPLRMRATWTKRRRSRS